MIYIYLFSFPNGKHYVGRTKNSLEQRCYEHKTRIGNVQHPLYYALQKYGWENIEKQILEVVSTHEEAVIKELHYIIKYNSVENGYNLTLNTEIGGDNWKGLRDTPKYAEFVQKMKLINSSENNGMYDRQHRQVTKDKMKEKAKGRYTQEWFKDRYGEVEGMIKYINRCSNRKGKLIGEENHSYKKVDTVQFKKDVLSGMKKVDICKKHNVISTAFTRRLNDIFGDTSLHRVRKNYLD